MSLKELLDNSAPIIKAVFSLALMRAVVVLFKSLRKHANLTDHLFCTLSVLLLTWYAVFSFIDASSDIPVYGVIYFYVDLLTMICLGRLLYKSIANALKKEAAHEATDRAD